MTKHTIFRIEFFFLHIIVVSTQEEKPEKTNDVHDKQDEKITEHSKKINEKKKSDEPKGIFIISCIYLVFIV